ncbi:MAG TPA: type II secretion system F family protein, partial [Chloroflexota bacterium]|nr:type II secretion system F family protein [Chloroflexota bacterium]
MTILLAVLAGSAVLLVMLGLYIPKTAPDPIKSRLSRFAERTMTLEDIEFEQPFTERVVRPAIVQASRVMRRFLPKKKKLANSDDPALGKMEKKLALAGNPNNLSANDFLGLIGVCMLGTAILVFLLLGLAGGDLVLAGGMGVVGLAIGYYLPTVWLNSKVRARQKEIQRAMPDSLDLLVISVEAGLGFDAALQRLTEKANHALAKEFRRVIAEIRMGRTRREALKEMVARTEVPDLNTFVSAIIQADQLGVSVAKVLTVQADQMRTLRRQRAEEAATKAPLKMLFPMILLIFPSMFIVILGPSIPT